MSATAFLVMTNIPPQTWLGTVSQQRQTLGRGKDAQLRVPAEFVHVSRHHAEIWTDQDGHWLKDLHSTSGTRVNGVPLAPDQDFGLVLGDHIWLGAAEFDLVGDPDLAKRRPAPHTLSRPDLEETSESQISRTIDFNPEAPYAFQALTPAELEIVLWMSRGLTEDGEIGQQLFRSPNTVRTHLRNIFSKLNVHSRDQLLACLLRRISASPEPKAD